MSVSSSLEQNNQNLWGGGKAPMKASYGKLMMWYFLISDTFTFAAFLLAYGAIRVTNVDSWPIANDVFNHVPGLHGHIPLVFVSIMTFILILSSVTMVRAVQEGHQMNKNGVIKWLIPTIIGGLMFLGCQYLEWTHLIDQGMNLRGNPFGAAEFGFCFFVITGFHGAHVTLGVLMNIWLVYATWDGKFERTGHYEMVEKLGLYWHFVDLVWVFVFLCFYLL